MHSSKMERIRATGNAETERSSFMKLRTITITAALAAAFLCGGRGAVFKGESGAGSCRTEH